MLHEIFHGVLGKGKERSVCGWVQISTPDHSALWNEHPISNVILDKKIPGSLLHNHPSKNWTNTLPALGGSKVDAGDVAADTVGAKAPLEAIAAKTHVTNISHSFDNCIRIEACIIGD